MAGSIQSTPYSIGYVELAYAIQNNFTYAAVKNAAGLYVVPSSATVAADADQKTNVSPTDFSIVNQPGATSYPISGYSWAILLQKQTSATTGAQVVKVLDWTTHTGGGQDLAAALEYVALPPAVQNQNRTTLLTVTGPSGQVAADQVVRRDHRIRGADRSTSDHRRETPRGGRQARLVARLPDGAYRGLLAAVAGVFVGLVVWFLVSIVVQARPAFSTLGFSWIFQKTWDPSHGKYGLLPFILGTIETTAIALVLAVPIGLGTAIALAYLVPRPAAGPAVDRGRAARRRAQRGLRTVGPDRPRPGVPEHRRALPDLGVRMDRAVQRPDEGPGLLLAGVILFVMVLPTMVAISRDVLAVVPNEQVEGAMALGATRWQVLRKVVVPGARTGLLGAFTLATGRALGETVAVALVIGNSPFIAHSLKSPAATLPSLIVNNFGEATGTELGALFGAGTGAAGHRHRGQRHRPGAGALDRPGRRRLGGGGVMAHPRLRRPRRPDPRAAPPDPGGGHGHAAPAQGLFEDRRRRSAGSSWASPSCRWWAWWPTW